MATCPTRSGCGSALTTSWTALAPARTRKTAISASISSRWRWLGAPRWAMPPRSRFHKRPARSSATQSLPCRRSARMPCAASFGSRMRLSWPNACGAGPNGIAYAWPTSRSGPVQQGRRRSQGPARRDRRRAATTQWLSRLAPVNDYARQGSAVMELLRPWVQRDAATARELCEHALRRLFRSRSNPTIPWAESADSSGPDGPAHRDLADGRAARLLDRSVVQADGRGSLGLVE